MRLAPSHPTVTGTASPSTVSSSTSSKLSTGKKSPEEESTSSDDLRLSLSRILLSGFHDIEFILTDGPYFIQRYNFSSGDYYQITYATDGIRVQHKTETIVKINRDV